MVPVPVTLAASGRPSAEPPLKAMFEARKHVFVDLLKWDVPVLDGRFELDQFDDPHAEYLIIGDGKGRHLASTRLLRTTRPHILDSLFPQLCATRVPRGPAVREITRFCLDPRVGALARREARNVLVSGLVEHALAKDIEIYTGVAEFGWFQQILAFGWRCRPLGLPQLVDGRMLCALAIEITPGTPALLAGNGIHRPTELAPMPTLEVA